MTAAANVAPKGAANAAIGRSHWLAEICSAAWERSPASARRLREGGFGPRCWPDWESYEALPVLHKRDLPSLQAKQPPLGGLSGQRPEILFLSPGDILDPGLPTAEARLADYMTAVGFTGRDVVLNGFNYHLTPAGLLFHNALRRLGCIVLPGGPQGIDAQIELAARAGASAFVGISSHLKLLIDKAEAGGRRIGRDIRLRLALAGGEPFGGPIRAELAQRHGIRCFDIYGSADVGIVAGGKPDAEGLPLLPGVLGEIVDPATGRRVPDGDPGHLVLTVDNPEYPLLRFGTGDVSALVPNAAEPSLIGVLGRLEGSARVRGMLLHETQLRQALAAHPAIGGGFVDVDRIGDRDRLTAFLQLRGGERAEAKAAFAERFQAVCRLTLDAVEEGGEQDGPLIRDRRQRKSP